MVGKFATRSTNTRASLHTARLSRQSKRQVSHKTAKSSLRVRIRKIYQDVYCTLIYTNTRNKPQSLRSLTSQSSSQLNVLLLDGDSLGVDSTQVGVLEQGDQVGFNGFSQSTDGRGLESQVGLEVSGDFSDQSLERQLSDQELSRLLESSDFSQGDGTWLISVRLLDTTGRWSRLSGSLGGQLLSWCLTTSRLSSCLLSSSHC